MRKGNESGLRPSLVCSAIFLQGMGDAAVRETDVDAAVSRLSAVNAGYLNDPFASCFVRRAQARPPLINIGTFVRTWAIQKLVNQFLDAHSQAGQRKKQILSLGAGTDTRFFRLAADGGPRAAIIHKYVEVDFPEATTKKAMVIKKESRLAGLLGTDVRLGQLQCVFGQPELANYIPTEHGGSSLTSDVYCLVPGDLRDFVGSLATRLLEILDPALPTLILAECVFIYLDPQLSGSILDWSVATFGSVGVMTILYDPVGLGDSFGRVMINNLRAGYISLHITRV